jgi:adenosylcobinamide kinase/adenosylcobinamide-phosphate guanylyltransferase
MGQVTLILGSAHSGKSSFAETRFASSSRVIFIATLQPSDKDMQERIATRRKARHPLWCTVEAPLHVPQILWQGACMYDGFLVDSITYYVWNLLAAVGKDRTDDQLLVEVERTIDGATMAQAPVVIVSGDVGGAVSSDPTVRRYQTLVGEANRMLASDADEVYQLIAGHADKVK